MQERRSSRGSVAVATLALAVAPVMSWGQVSQEALAVYFETASAQVDGPAGSTLDSLAAVASAADVYAVSLRGHADVRGASAYNEGLSARRAAAVRARLEAAGLDAAYITMESFGEREASVVGGERQGLRSDRRVELRLTTERVQTVARLHELLAERYGTTATIKHDVGGVLRGPAGTTVMVPAGAFEHADGTPLRDGDAVSCRLDEALTPGAMIAHRLSTNGASGRLRTGGMVRVVATAGGEELRLKAGAALAVEIPTDSLDPTMRLYVGEREPTLNGALDWTLAAGEQADVASRLSSDGSSATSESGYSVPPDAPEQVYIDRLLRERDSLFALVAFPESLLDLNVREPMLPDFPRAFDPEIGRPKRPFLGIVPTRTEITRGRFPRSQGALQREADEQFLRDSLAYAAAAPKREGQLVQWRAAEAAFEETIPTRRAAHSAKVEEVRRERVERTRAYLRDQHRAAAVRGYLDWEKYARGKGPAAEDFDPYRPRRRVFELEHGAARPLPYISRAYGSGVARDIVVADTAGLSMARHRMELFDELGVASLVEEASRRQREAHRVFEVLRRKRRLASLAAAETMTARLERHYRFEIRTPQPQWHNCDHPVPPGEFQLLVESGDDAAVYFASGAYGTVDFYPPGGRAAAVYDAPVSVEVVAFEVTGEGIRLGRMHAVANKQQRGRRLTYRPASLTEVENVLAGLASRGEG